MELIYVDPSSVPDNLVNMNDVESAIAYKILNIKAEAERRISALDWRLQRAQEREQLGETGVETVADVLALREQIRQASNAAELAVATLVSVEDVLAFTWYPITRTLIGSKLQTALMLGLTHIPR